MMGAKVAGRIRKWHRRFADRVGYMCHPNWVVRSDRKPPEALWKAETSGQAGFAKTAAWYREAGWL